MAYTTIDKPSDYFNTVLWTGNDTDDRTISGVGFSPNWVWIKARNNGDAHYLVDTVRGSTKVIFSDSNSAEDTRVSAVKSFASDGYVLGQEAQVNRNSGTFVAWNWKAETAFSNDASSTSVGSIDSAGSVNTTAGFSIITYTGTGSAATVAHGLGVAPKLIINRTISAAKEWDVYYGDPTDYLVLNTNAATVDASDKWNDTAPTSTVWSIESSSQNNTSGGSCLAYCFAEKQGYSKIGSYTGNGSSTDGAFVHTGFKPAWIMFKSTSATGFWEIHDNKRDPFNVSKLRLFPNSSNAEATEDYVDFVSNGFKFRTNDANGNTSGTSYIYLAFAENPFVTSTGIPATAR